MNKNTNDVKDKNDLNVHDNKNKPALNLNVKSLQEQQNQCNDAVSN